MKTFLDLGYKVVRTVHTEYVPTFHQRVVDHYKSLGYDEESAIKKAEARIIRAQEGYAKKYPNGLML